MHVIIAVLIALSMVKSVYGQQTRLDAIAEDATNWVRELIKKDPNLHLDMDFLNIPNHDAPIQKQCRTNTTDFMNNPFKMYVFLSFSVPRETWLELSKDLQKVNGVIVLKGLPENSFIELAKRIQELDKEGLSIPVQIDPLLFEKYSIVQTPSYIVVEENRFDKVTGNLSINGALELIASKGETQEGKRLLLKLRGEEG